MQELFIPVRMPNLNDFIDELKRNRYSGGKMKDEWDTIVVQQCKLQKLGHFTEPVTIEFHWYEPNFKRDQDNVAFAKKFILDGLQKAGVLTNDNYRWVKGFSDTFHYEKTAGVRIIMKEIEYGTTNSVDGNLRRKRLKHISR